MTSATVALMAHHAVIDDADFVAHIGQFRQDVAADHDRLSLLAKPPEHRPHFDAGPRIEAAEWFIQQQHLRLVQEHAGKAQALRLAARESVGVSVAFEIEIDQFELFVADLPSLGSADAICGSEEFEVLDHLHIVVHAEEIGHVADQPANLFRIVIDRVAADVGLAERGMQQRGEDFHRRRFARTIGADEAEQIPRLQIQVDILDGVHLAIFLRQFVRLDHWRCVS